MVDPSIPAPAPPVKRRIWRWWLAVLLLLPLVLAGIGAGLFAVIGKEERARLMRAQVIAALESAMGPDHPVKIESVSLTLSGLHPSMTVHGLSIGHPDQGAHLALQKLVLDLQSLALWQFTLAPSAIRFEGMDITLPQRGATLPALRQVELIRNAVAGLAMALTGQDERLSTLQTVQGQGISLNRAMLGGSATPLLSGMTLALSRTGDGAVLTQIGRVGQPEIAAFAARMNAGTITFATQKLDMRSLAALSAHALPWLSPETGVEATLVLTLSAQQTVERAQARLALTNGRLTLPDNDIPPFDLNEAAFVIGVNPASAIMSINELSFRAGETNVQLKGTLTPQPGEDGGFALSLAAQKAEIDRPSPAEPVVALEGLVLEGALSPSLGTFTLDRLAFGHGKGDVTVSGTFSVEAGGLIETHVAAREIDARAALRIWPVSTAPPVRRWVGDHVQAGRLVQLSVRSSLAGQALEDAFSHRPIPDAALDIHFRVEDGRITPLPDAPPLTDALVMGTITGRKAQVQVEKASILPPRGLPLAVRNAQFTIADTSFKPATLEMILPVSGTLDAFFTTLDAPSLRLYAPPIPAEAARAEGQIEGRARAALRLVEKPTPQDVKVEFAADLKGVAIDNIIKGDKLENGSFQLVSKADALSIKGEGRLSGLPAQIELRGQGREPLEATIRLVMDDAQRAKRGFEAKSLITGPVGVVIIASLGKPGAPDMKVELDLLRAKVEGIAPGLIKRAGQPASARFTLLTKGETTVLESLEVDLGAIQARGTLDFGKDQQLIKADLTSIRFSPGDNARLQAERTRNLLKLTLRGNSFDVRPFLKGFQTGKIDDPKAVDLDLDVQTTVLVGFGGELLSAADIQASKRAGRLTRLAAKGRFGAQPLIVATQTPGADPLLLNVQTRDAGALLRFMDLYHRMVGGRMASDIEVFADRQGGSIQVRDFVLRGEPALQQFAASATSPSGGETGSVPPVRLNPDEVDFTKLRADFVRRPGRLDLNEAVMWGNAVGGSLDGTLDYAQDRVDLKGSLVPAYALNNLFSQVPLIGRLLGGSQYEGLFAMPFLINGKVSSPVLRINPLSVIAPGFLRRFFEVQRQEKPEGQ